MWHKITVFSHQGMVSSAFFGLSIHSCVFVFPVLLFSLIFLPLLYFILFPPSPTTPRPSLCNTTSCSAPALLLLLSQSPDILIGGAASFSFHFFFKPLCQEVLELWLTCGDPAQSAPKVTVQQSCLERTSVQSGMEWPGCAGQAVTSRTQQRVWLAVCREVPGAWDWMLVHKKRQKRYFWLTLRNSVMQWLRQHQMGQMCLGEVFHPDRKTSEHFVWDRKVENIPIYFGEKQSASWRPEKYR